MKIEIIKKIKSLPPLNETATEIIEFNKKENKTNEELVSILEKDPLVVATLLKVANSALFGFRYEVDSIDNLVYLLGMEFVISLVIGNSIQNNFDTCFDPYGINSNEFREVSCLYTNFMSAWVSQIEPDLKKSLYLPIFLSDLGKCILANEVNNSTVSEVFAQQIQKYPTNIEKTEKDLCGYNSTEVTVLLLENWNLNKELIDHIRYICDIDSAPESLKRSAQIINVTKTICNITNPMADEFKTLGLERAKAFGFDLKPLQKAMEKMEDRLLDAS